MVHGGMYRERVDVKNRFDVSVDVPEGQDADPYVKSLGAGLEDWLAQVFPRVDVDVEPADDCLVLTVTQPGTVIGENASWGSCGGSPDWCEVRYSGAEPDDIEREVSNIANLSVIGFYDEQVEAA